MHLRCGELRMRRYLDGVAWGRRGHLLHRHLVILEHRLVIHARQAAASLVELVRHGLVKLVRLVLLHWGRRRWADHLYTWLSAQLPLHMAPLETKLTWSEGGDTRDAGVCTAEKSRAADEVTGQGLA